MPPESWNLDSIQNVGHTVTETARRMPDAAAVIAARLSHRNPIVYDQITFSELEDRSNGVARAVIAAGVQPGTRIALLVPPGIDFVSHVFGLFKAGVVVILIDPGMGRQNMIRCLAEAEPAGMVGIGRAHIARWLFRSRFRKCRKNFIVGRRRFPGCLPTDAPDPAAGPFEPVPIDRESPAAIIFTTGSTGPPKGVLYRHRIFLQQAQRIREYFSIPPGTVDVSGFPLFALFNSAMGATTIFPRMDATRPAEVHPPDIFDAVERFQADQSFGSPALWNTVSRYCEQHGVTLPGIRRVLSAGAPVPPATLARIRKVIAPDGEAYTPYGATEALPLACNSATVVLGETAERTNQGAGTCVGNRFPGIEWQIIRISDQPLATLADTEPLPAGEIGELIVRGDVVTDRYVTRTAANAEHKITDGDSFWHRMGDVGYLDDQDRFWFCGRKSHRVRTPAGMLFTIPIEAIFNTHPAIYRSALVGVGSVGEEVPHLIVEPFPEHQPASEAAWETLRQELFELGQTHENTRMISADCFLWRSQLPTDIRHNSKIFREQLREWAAEQRK